MAIWLVPIIVALIAPLAAYLGIARKLSGRIAHSDAEQLWEEARVMREEYRTRALECELEIKKLRDELQTCTTRNTTLRRENRRLRNDPSRPRS